MNEPAPTLLTGAAGVVGTALRERLPAYGHRLRLTDARPLEAPAFIQTDIGDLSAMRAAMAGCRAVVHLAGLPHEGPWPDILRRNIDGTRQVFAAAVEAGVRTIVYASSIQVVGGHPADAMLGPTLAVRPSGEYGTSKCFGEGLLSATVDAHGLIGFSVRICSFRDRPRDARALRTWLSPDDAARLIDRCLRWGEPGYHMVWGVSANRRRQVEDPVATMIGYRPEDDADDHVDRLTAEGIDVSIVSEWQRLGGSMAPLSARTVQEHTPHSLRASCNG